MRYSILHLSDLHRDSTDEIPNDWLIDSIDHDLERLSRADSDVPRPSLCVVSGDLVYGVAPHSPNAEKELTRQNQQALDFLAGLTDRLFGGDRSHVVILPGNHDVAYKKVVESSTPVPHPASDLERAQLVREYLAPNSSLRWSWQDLAFHRIIDANVYADRLAYFCDLYKNFYQGVRCYPLEAEAQFDLFDYPELKLGLLTLNSCYGNDPWRRAGRINSTALTAACRQLRSTSRSGWLLAAAWHHNLAGGPLQEDYLDSGFLQFLIDSGVSLGLHGHQHRPEWFDERYRLGSKARKIAITSAATLCAGPSGLSPGTPRGYNVIELDNEVWTGRLHQRQMINHQFDMPVWGPGTFVETNSSYVDFQLSTPLNQRPIGLDMQLALEAADNFLGRGAWRQAIEALKDYMGHPMARRMCVKALEELADPVLTIEVLRRPRENEEAVVLGNAVFESGDATALGLFLSDPFVVQAKDASVKEIVSRLLLRSAR